MTVKELSQLYWLGKEIKSDQQRLERLRAEAGSISSPGANAMPHGGGSRHGKVERLAVDIVDLQAIIEQNQARCIRERDALARYIAGIPDSLTRQVFQLRFMDGMTWAEVAACVGGKNTEGGVKKLCYRYLKQDK